MQPQRIALVRMDNLGDHVLGAGVIRALRTRYPQAQLTAVIAAPLMDLYARCAQLSAILPLPPASTYLQSDESFTQLTDYVRGQQKYDWVINPRFAEDWYAAGALCAALSSPGGRVLGFRQSFSPITGFDPNHCYTELLDAPADLHTARYAELIAMAATGTATAASPEVWFSDEDWLRVSRSLSLKPQSFVVVGLGASFAYKRPATRTYQQIVHLLLSQSLRVVLTGTDADSAVAELLQESCRRDARLISACGQLRLYELAALLAAARLYIGPDAGPKHMAAAGGTPVLEIEWVPADYPVSSRGPGTAGRCWSAWQTLSRSVRPRASVFAQASARPEFYSEPIGGLDADEIARCVAELLAATSASAGLARHRT